MNLNDEAGDRRTDTHAMLSRLECAGISHDDALALCSISMTLHRWHVLESGTEYWGIERDEETGAPYCVNSRTRRRAHRVADREASALKRLATIMARYPWISAYVQGDPRGVALYILRPGDVPKGGDVETYYSRGLAVYK